MSGIDREITTQRCPACGGLASVERPIARDTTYQVVHRGPAVMTCSNPDCEHYRRR